MSEWWRDTIVYQIYPRSFCDSNGDGFGDIRGIISHLDDLAELGVGTIWLSPVYPSPDADNGYDIADYCAVDPKYGTLDDMDVLFAQAAKRGIRVIMDLVINHTSDEHVWFQKSRRGEPIYKDYYIWKDKPNNWTGFFMEDAWTYDEVRGAYYLHLFHSKQPDLNWHNPALLTEVKRILRFWLDRGAAGFRCDVINVLYKNDYEDAKKRLVLTGLEKYHSTPGTHAILRELRKVLDEYDAFTVGESVMTSLPQARDLCGASRRELNTIFYFDHLETDRVVSKYIPKPFSAKRLLKVLTKWQQGLEWNAVYLENHDQPRIVSHYGSTKSPKTWARSAKLLAMLEFGLRGTPFIYQGQEIGMTNFDFTGIDQLNDVESKNMDVLMRRLHIPRPLRWRWIRLASRDNARTPMQWDNGFGAGFTDGEPWLAINSNYKSINYESQRNDRYSVLNFYKSLIKLRDGSMTLRYGTFEPVYADRYVMAFEREYERNKLQIWLNFSEKGVEAELEGEILLSNTGRKALDGTLRAWEGLILLVTGDRHE